MNGTPISSSKNSIFLLQQKILKSKNFRRKEGLIWLEGLRAVNQCPPEKIKALFLGPKAPQQSWPCPPYTLSTELSKKVFVTETPQEVGCLLHKENNELNELNWSQGVMILDSLQDPGNVGSLIRTAAGLGYGGLVLLSSTDVGNPKLLRSSAGCFFEIPLCETSDRRALLEYLKEHDIQVYCADAGGSSSHIKTSKSSFALVIGSEANGLGPDWEGSLWTLPLANNVESLNAAVAGALLAYILKQ